VSVLFISVDDVEEPLCDKDDEYQLGFFVGSTKEGRMAHTWHNCTTVMVFIEILCTNGPFDVFPAESTAKKGAVVLSLFRLRFGMF